MTLNEDASSHNNIIAHTTVPVLMGSLLECTSSKLYTYAATCPISSEHAVQEANSCADVSGEKLQEACKLKLNYTKVKICKWNSWNE